MKIIINIVSKTILALLFTSCDRPTCVNDNPIFDKFSPNEKVYKNELVNQLRLIEKSKLRYWSHDYKVENGSEYLYANIQSEEICAIIVLNITKSTKGIEHLIEKKNMSYKGAELEDLQFDIKKENETVEFFFKEISGIRD